MEDPVSLDFGVSSLFGDEKVEENPTSTISSDLAKPQEQESEKITANDGTEDLIDLGTSTLFDNFNTNTASETSNTTPTESSVNDKEVKLFDGSKLVLKHKKKTTPIINESIQSEKLTMVDMDVLFRKAEQRQKFRANQKLHPSTKEVVHEPTTVWTEKYRPKRFVQLCSGGNDKQYRLMSHWLKKWSSSVFQEDAVEDDTVDSLGRPLRKFLLITGPSGIGKTAAAHVIAKQLGYNVEELNAANSMDSLPNSSGVSNTYTNIYSTLKLKIQNALSSNSMQRQGNKLVQQGKPTCLIIDEIDTAANSSDIIRVLNDINVSDRKAFAELQNKNGFLQPQKNNKKSKLLTRPIICIANDAYSTNSRTYGGFNMDKLRQMSEIVTLHKPSFQKTNSGIKRGGKAISSVKDFMKEICDKEHLKLDYRQISEMVEICEGDIRACINHLQFNGRTIDTTLIDGEASISNKDAQISWFRLTDMLFKRDGQLDKEEDFQNLMHIVMEGSAKSASSSSNTLDKVVRGCFNRYLDSVHYQDDSLLKPCELSDWLEFYDRLGVHDSGDYSSLVTLKFWSLFSEINPNKASKPLVEDMKSLQFESDDLKKINKSIIKSCSDKLPIGLSLSLGGGLENNEVFGTFILPLLSRVISPDMVSSGSGSSLAMKSKSSLNDFDKKSLERAAETINQLGINLETSRDISTNQITLELNPNIDSLTVFKSPFAPIGHETLTKQIQTKRKWFFPLLQSELDRINTFTSTSKVDAKRKQEEDPTAAKKKQKVTSSLEFFKGQYDGLSEQILQAKDTVDLEARRIWVKYNEGFSNAVRKHIGWDDLWAE